MQCAGQTPETGEPASSSANRHTTFLRGVAEVDAAGVVTFNTIVPGRYMGRAFHVHYAVRSHTASAIGRISSSPSVTVPVHADMHAATVPRKAVSKLHMAVQMLTKFAAC